MRPKAPGIGFAIGEDRLILTLQAQEGELAAPKLDSYIAPVGPSQNSAALALARVLRRGGLQVEIGDGNFRLKKSFEAAERVARTVILLGDEEAEKGTVRLKDFATGVQSDIPQTDIVRHLLSIKEDALRVTPQPV